MLEWVQQRPEWPTLPGRTFVQPNVLMPSVARSSSVMTTGAQRVPVHELVFFGRLEVLKGFHIFCDALDILFSSSRPLPLGVTFLGRPNFGTSSDSAVDAVARIRDRARQWSIEPIILTGAETAPAMRVRPNTLAFQKCRNPRRLRTFVTGQADWQLCHRSSRTAHMRCSSAWRWASPSSQAPSGARLNSSTRAIRNRFCSLQLRPKHLPMLWGKRLSWAPSLLDPYG